MRRLVELLPTAVDVRVRTVAWLNLIANVMIIATGGTVRLTGSGLGCDVWPGCTSTSFLPGIDEGIHGIIEFGNRTLTGVLGILALLAVLLVWRMRSSRRDLWILSLIILGGIVVQALVGLIVVQTELEMSTVGVHYLFSAILVGVATSLVLRTRREAGPRERAVPVWLLALVHLTSLLMAAVVVVGILTTGSGPHSGDAEVQRDSSAWEQLAHLHAWLGYALSAGLVAVLVGAIVVRARRTAIAAAATIAVVIVQIVVGVVQARTGIPPLLVGIHMVLAAVSVAALVVLVDSVKRPVAADAEGDLGQRSPSPRERAVI